MGIGIRGSGYIEKVSLAQAKSLVNAVKATGGKLQKGEKIFIMYNDGSVKHYTDADDMSKAQTAMASGIAYQNAGAIGISGKGFKFVGHDEDSKALAEQYNKQNLSNKGSKKDSSGSFINTKTANVSVNIDKEYQDKQQNKKKKK